VDGPWPLAPGLHRRQQGSINTCKRGLVRSEPCLMCVRGWWQIPRAGGAHAPGGFEAFTVPEVDAGTARGDAPTLARDQEQNLQRKLQTLRETDAGRSKFAKWRRRDDMIERWCRGASSSSARWLLGEVEAALRCGRDGTCLRNAVLVFLSDVSRLPGVRHKKSSHEQLCSCDSPNVVVPRRI
jgi:hypothetical protein